LGGGGRSLGAAGTVFFTIYRVFFFMLLSDKLTNSETAVHNTTLITLHNAIISVAVFVAARTLAPYAYNTILLEEIVIAPFI